LATIHNVTDRQTIDRRTHHNSKMFIKTFILFGFGCRNVLPVDISKV